MSEKSTSKSAKLDELLAVAGDKLPRSVVLVLSILLFTAFVMLLNETTLAVALPPIMSVYGISAATAQWLLTGFMFTLAVAMPTTGTVIAALAPSFVVLLQGVAETIALAHGANSASLATGSLSAVTLVLSLFIKKIPAEPTGLGIQYSSQPATGTE